MDKITIDRIKTAHPKIKDELNVYYTECNNMLPKGVRLRFSHVYRSPKEQDALFNQKPKVTNAKGWQSIHNYGLAFDYVILLDKDNNGTFESVDWDVDNEYHKIVISYFKSKGYEWGGDWRKFPDYPHFQKSFGFDWKTLKARHDKGITISDSGIVYPKI